MQNRKGLTIIIPAYNEEQGITGTLNSLMPITIKHNWQIIVVNDGSIDLTQNAIESFISSNTNTMPITLINHKINKGYGAALKTGIKHAETEYIAMYDADGQHNPDDLLNMWHHIGDTDMLIGQRGKDSHQDWVRKPGKWVLGRVANLLTGRKIPDLNSGLRIIKREVLINKLHLFSNAFSFSTTSTVALMSMGYSVDYFPIKVNKRIGTSTVKQFKHGSTTILLILRLIMLFNPLKVFLPLSAIFFIVGMIYELIWGVVLSAHIKLLPTALFLFIAGVLVFLFGLVADQISEMRKNLIER